MWPTKSRENEDVGLQSSENVENGRQDAQEPERARDEPEEEVAEEEETFPTLEAVERQLITRALKTFNGNRRQTARTLGISERTLYRKLKEFEEDL